MRLFVGLGNPGSEYERTRHNLGFVVVTQIARRHGFHSWRRGYQGEIAEGSLNHEKVVLLRPLTFMNESGRAVREAANFFRLTPNAITLFHDEIGRPPGQLPVKIAGG